MTFPFSANSLVKDIVNELPKTSDVFKRYRIDFCCGGNIPLSEAATQGDLDIDSILEDLKAVYEKNESKETDLEVWTNSDSNTIIDHVIANYHRATEEEFKMLSPYVTKVSRVHGDNHPELLKVYELYQELKKEMLEHMAKEEETVFPIIRKLADGTVENREEAINMIIELEKEHDNAGAILKELRKITGDFTPPIDTCGTYRLVYNRLEDLEGLTFMHVHLENNILFPRYI
ncbi:iron-sulfur cluster repair di-iron protein [Neobacillus rhizophilus]|uniref:Iron-sulfur cluster repair di-iron protein n=2 Tax=Neobacillus TaxID=2675232 RepID=A0A942U0A8_9BACI|nr:MULTISPECIES: iron-sulfur cluster repair di-iron protein [Neobacillus]MBS4212166.1 iron-sulfur cluster repair di-iron protein [Neobacillus rhizophilus]MBU8915596.1 iron-sulfur cluster repair di-iron protein [Bacillus sp. FJAT-29953]